MNARLFHGDTAAHTAVTLAWDTKALTLHEATGTVHLWRWQDVRADAPDGTPWRLFGPNDAMLEVDGEGDINSLRQALGRRPIWRPGKSLGGLLVVACVAACVGAFFLSDPLSAYVAQRVPLAWERRLGALLNGQLEARICETPQQKDLLDRLTQRLTARGAAPPEVAVHLVDMGQANAFTLPGGTLVVDHHLIAMMEQPEELAAVLAHEIEHARLRHVMHAIVRGAVLSSLWNVVVGDYTSILVLDPATLYNIAALRFSRQAERDADAGAVHLLVDAGIDPHRGAALFSRLSKVAGKAELLSTHPSNVDRVEVFTEAVPQAVARAWPSALTPADWDILKSGCTRP